MTMLILCVMLPRSTVSVMLPISGISVNSACNQALVMHVFSCELSQSQHNHVERPSMHITDHEGPS